MNHKVLVVDDSAAVRNQVMGYLESQGIPCDPAVDGLDALSRLRDSGDQYRLAIVDINMPFLDGWQFDTCHLAF